MNRSPFALVPAAYISKNTLTEKVKPAAAQKSKCKWYIFDFRLRFANFHLLLVQKHSVSHLSTLLRSSPGPVWPQGAGTLEGSPRRPLPVPESAVWRWGTRWSAGGTDRLSVLDGGEKKEPHVSHALASVLTPSASLSKLKHRQTTRKQRLGAVDPWSLRSANNPLRLPWNRPAV